MTTELDSNTLEWAAEWLEGSLNGELNERVREFGKNMAMTLRAAKSVDSRASVAASPLAGHAFTPADNNEAVPVAAPVDAEVDILDDERVDKELRRWQDGILLLLKQPEKLLWPQQKKSKPTCASISICTLGTKCPQREWLPFSLSIST